MQGSDKKEKKMIETEAIASGKSEVKMPCEIWSRPCGYMRPVSNYNPGKQQEFADRKTYNMTKPFRLKEKK